MLDDPVTLAWGASVLAGIGVFILFIGLRIRRASAETVDDRIRRYALKPSARDIELSEPFLDRVIKPSVQSVLRFVGRLAPRRNMEELERNLWQAGTPFELAPLDFLGARLLATVGLGLMAAASAYVIGWPLRAALVFGGVGAGLGFYAPMVWLRWKIGTRRTEIQRALPDCIDLLVVCIDAGLGFDSALLKVAQRWQHQLARELDRVIYEVRIGMSRVEALQGLVNRTGVEDVATFVAVVVQAQQLGVSVGKALQIHAEQIRVLRRYRAEEQGRQAALKMLFPLVFLIFPALFAVILGPAIPQLLRTLANLG
jgi:tight adherence protein C